MRLRLTARNIVIDTGVLTLYFTGNELVRPYFNDVERNRRNGYLTGVNLSEYFYKTCESLGEKVAEIRFQQCRKLLKIIETSGELSILAGKEKCHGHGGSVKSSSDRHS